MAGWGVVLYIPNASESSAPGLRQSVPLHTTPTRSHKCAVTAPTNRNAQHTFPPPPQTTYRPRIQTLSCVETDDLVYLDFIHVARELVKELREHQGAQLVVALTHMREPNDIRLAAEVAGIDAVLG